MPRQLPPLNALRSFEAAARYESFTRAAEELHVTQGAVSQSIKLLEKKLGVLLFLRLPRQTQLTAEGERFAQAVRDGLDAIANTAEFNKAIEKYVVRYPEQWLWVHRRWKTRPPGFW